MKKLCSLFLAVLLAAGCAACGQQADSENPLTVEPGLSQMKAICELSTMECYYHNVAKYYEKDASGFGPFKKDKHFWIEYSGVVKMGVDTSLVNVEVKDDTVTITLPQAQVLGVNVDSATLTKDCYIVDPDSAAITAEDEMQAFQEAQNKMKDSASADQALLGEAQQRAQLLLSDYVNNIGEAAGKKYSIQWIYLTKEGIPSGQTAVTEAKSAASSEST